MKSESLKKYSIVFVFIGILMFIGWFLFSKINEVSIAAMMQDYEPPAQLEKLEDNYDVVVIGGEPEGVAAAVSAARNGMKTLLVEHRDELGGLMTYGMLNFIDLPQGINDKPATEGIFKEWHELVGGESTFGILAAKAAFLKLVQEEENLTLSVGTEVLHPIVEDDTVNGVQLSNDYGQFTVHASRFIDATQDADFTAKSGAPYFIGGEDINLKDRKMAVTLMIHLKNVDWQGVKKAVDEEIFGAAGISESAAWGFSDLHYDYKPVEENTRLRGLNIAKVDDDYYINALQIFGVDGLNEQEKQQAIEKGKRETKHIVAYLRENFPGFEHAEIASYPTELYVRETRHIIAEYQLPMSDVWENKDHWDSIAYGAYPVDVQAQSVNDYGYVIANPIQYAIPFRSLIPKKIDQLLVVGRSAGFSSLAAGSARVIPTGMGTGQAAGAAAALSVKENTGFREMLENASMIEDLRATLAEQGALVAHFELDYPYKGEWYYPQIRALLNIGMLSGGYNNDLQVDDEATKYMFVKQVKSVIKRGNPSLYEEYIQELTDLNVYLYNEENEPLTRDLAAKIVAEVFIEEAVNDDAWQKVQALPFIDEKLAELLNKNRVLQKKEVYYLIGLLLEDIT